MRNRPSPSVQTPTIPFNFRTFGAQRLLVARMTISNHSLQTFNWSKMQDKTGEVGPPASGRTYFADPYLHFVLNGSLAPVGIGYRQL